MLLLLLLLLPLLMVTVDLPQVFLLVPLHPALVVVRRQNGQDRVSWRRVRPVSGRHARVRPFMRRGNRSLKLLDGRFKLMPAGEIGVRDGYRPLRGVQLADRRHHLPYTG
ncbi:hypothetical protein ACFWAX_40460, partial [Streptomyces sp. NPDC059956]|uniref:hypothetical protein n=1 Tax=Streptomyces sp. NPDC059956 TaxID=3347015 RepID=UPI003658DB4D